MAIVSDSLLLSLNRPPASQYGASGPPVLVPFPSCLPSYFSPPRLFILLLGDSWVDWPALLLSFDFVITFTTSKVSVSFSERSFPLFSFLGGGIFLP